LVNDSIVSDPKEISNHFGQHFHNATEKLLQETQNPQSSNVDFDNFPREENSAFFHATTPGEVEKILKSLPNKASSKADFPIFLLKHFSSLVSSHICTKDATLDFVFNVTKSFTDKIYGVALFADFSKAFDTICHQRLLFKLEKMGFRGVTNNLLSSYLESRKQYIDILGETSEEYSINHGVPQGSNLGPTLFNLYASDLHYFLRSLHLIQFADDTSFLAVGNDLNLLLNTIQSEIHIFSQWAFVNKLALNASKTKLMILTNRQVAPQVDISVNNTVLEVVHNYKFLGTTLDDKLNFSVNLKELQGKISQLTGISYRVGPFLNESSARSLYFAIVHSRLSYGITIWGGTANTHLNPLQISQNKIIRNLFGHKFPLLSTTLLFYKQGILKLEDMYKLELGLVIYKALYVKGSYEIVLEQINKLGWKHHYNTRKLNEYMLPKNRVNADNNGFLFKAISNWNVIPFEIKTSTSVHMFKKSYKALLLSKYTSI